MPRFLVILICLLIASMLPIHSSRAASVEACSSDMKIALRQIMGIDEGQKTKTGYFKKLRDRLSTTTPTYHLLDEVEHLAHDAKIELAGLCHEMGRFPDVSPEYVMAYSLESCRDVNLTLFPQDSATLFTQCQSQSDEMLQTFLNSLGSQLLLTSVRTSLQPMLDIMRSLNSRLVGLIEQYNRLVGNFSKFSFRLGDTIVGKPD